MPTDLSFRRHIRLAAAALFVASGATATTVATTAAVAAPAGAATKLPSCNLSALTKHQGAVNINFWESASSANLTVLQGIASAFNS